MAASTRPSPLKSPVVAAAPRAFTSYSYRPRYFHSDGIAVHGYDSVPSYPASHGCVRVTEPAMDFIWAEKLMPVGSEVWVH